MPLQIFSVYLTKPLLEIYHDIKSGYLQLFSMPLVPLKRLKPHPALRGLGQAIRVWDCGLASESHFGFLNKINRYWGCAPLLEYATADFMQDRTIYPCLPRTVCRLDKAYVKALPRTWQRLQRFIERLANARWAPGPASQTPISCGAAVAEKLL